eukprot:4007880-Pyramimonas_sp.AAC.1
MIKQKCILFENMYRNGDGILAFVPDAKVSTMARVLLTDSGYYLLPIDVFKPQTEQVVDEMVNLIEERIHKLFSAFDHRRKPKVQLHTASQPQGPEAQNQSEISRLAAPSTTPPSRQTYG